MKTEMNTLYEEFPFRSVKKFVPLAIKHGFTKQEAIQFLNSLAHDKKYDRQSKMMLPIFSRHSNGYQMDTLVQTSQASPRYFLIIININSRKLYAYPMNQKNSSEVMKALKTLRDLNNDRDFTIQSMNKALIAYNNTIHSSTNKEPNEFTNEDEERYIENKELETNMKTNLFNLPNN